MKKKYSLYIILAILLFSSCIKAYVPIVSTPFTVTDVAGGYKGGSLITEKTLLDTVTYKSVDDTSSFTLTYYYKDTLIVSIVTNSGVTDKRYKLALYDSVSNTEATVFRFQKIIVDSAYYLYRKVYNLEVNLYYPGIPKKSSATITNSAIISYTPNTIYLENEVFTALKQPL